MGEVIYSVSENDYTQFWLKKANFSLPNLSLLNEKVTGNLGMISKDYSF